MSNIAIASETPVTPKLSAKDMRNAALIAEATSPAVAEATRVQKESLSSYDTLVTTLHKSALVLKKALSLKGQNYIVGREYAPHVQAWAVANFTYYGKDLDENDDIAHKAQKAERAQISRILASAALSTEDKYVPRRTAAKKKGAQKAKPVQTKATFTAQQVRTMSVALEELYDIVERLNNDVVTESMVPHLETLGNILTGVDNELNDVADAN